MKSSAAVSADVPPDAVTSTLTVPGVSVGGETAVIDVAELTTTLVAALPPKVTLEPTVKKVPVIVTDVPPPDGPLLGLTEVTVGGADARNVNWSPALVEEVPAPFVTVTSTVPAATAGETAEIEVGEFTTTPAAAVPPKFTVAPLTKLVPVMVTWVPPPVGPEFGLTAETVGVTAL